MRLWVCVPLFDCFLDYFFLLGQFVELPKEVARIWSLVIVPIHEAEEPLADNGAAEPLVHDSHRKADIARPARVLSLNVLETSLE